MKSIDEFMSHLRELNVKLWLDGDQLACRAPKGVMTKDLAADLTARKADILRYLQQAELSAVAPQESILVISRDQPLPLSFGQQRLWFLDQLEGASATYNMPLAITLEGALDIPALQKALNEIMRRHEVLHCNFRIADEQAVIVRQEQMTVPLTIHQGAETEALHWVRQAAARCFDLAKDPLVHATLVQWSEHSHLFLLTMHHIVSDGWSLGLFLSELASLYAAFSKKQPSPLPELTIQYADYANWQRQRLQGETLDKLLGYWRKQLSGAPETLALPMDHPRPPVQTYHGRSLNAQLDADLTQRLHTLSQAMGGTLFMTLLSGFALLLSRYSGQEDVVIGTPVANRNHPDIEKLIGLFINTLALRIDLSGEPLPLTLLQRVKHVCLGAYEHQDLPFEQLVEELKPPRSLSYSPVFQVSFEFQNTPMDAIAMDGLTLSTLQQEAVAAKFDLSLSVEEVDDQLYTTWTYNPDLFDESSIVRMQEHYRRLLLGLTAEQSIPVSQLPLLDEQEQRTLSAENATELDYPAVQSFLELFAAQVRENPERIALSMGAQSLSYQQLQQRVMQLAGALQALGIGMESPVALCVERSVDMVIGLLGIMQAGGVYIPLDPAYPTDRLNCILTDAQPLLILTQQQLEFTLPASSARVLCLDRDGDMLAMLAEQNPFRPASINGLNLAYIIFTSGSTGRPKGVQIPHQALLNFLLSMQKKPGFSSQDRLLAVTTISFDIAALELYLPLISGAHLHLASRETALDGRQLQAVLQTHNISHMQATPATWRLLLETDWQPCKPFSIFCGGEALPSDLAQQLLEKGVKLWNLYGPTETTVWSSAREVDRANLGEKGVEPVGPPIHNTQIHILNKYRQLQPVRVPGELHIGGDGLARGYLNQPVLTADSYRPDPFSTVPGARLYRTGDLACRLVGGNFDFLGRIDHQVKIRGYRIELGEIEAILRQHPDVTQAVVMVREDIPGDQRLIAYVLTVEYASPGADELRHHLKASLPEYMLPAAFVFMDVLPLTDNGKINRKALPAPDVMRPELNAQYTAPRNALENSISDIWRQTLRLEHVGIDDNFFDLGGHSLLLTRVYEALRKQIAEPFALITLFQYPTIRSLAARLTDQPKPAPLHIRANAARLQGNEIAVIGLSGRFPGADDLQSFWRNLCEGRESISFFDEDELLASGIEAELIAMPNYVRANGILSDVAGFDAAFFGYTPAEAKIIDPQQRLFLENAWHTLEHAGYANADKDIAIGVFAGSSHNGYLMRNIIPYLYSSDAHSIYNVMLGNDKDFLSTRVSYALNLQGPSVNIQTACSTSLVAIHMACRSLLDGECDMALAGGVGLKIPQKSGYVHEEGMINSPDGHCRAFDAMAKGTTWGSGLGVVLLKPLHKAVADRDTIHAVIKGSAINNDGAVKIGFTAPSVEGQAAVIVNAQAQAGVAPESISYIEAHGTGTRLGDVIEMTALTQAFQLGTEKTQFCALGALKTNIGHLDTASGVAGFCKAVLALQHKKIPPTLHFQQPNPEIDFEHSPFYVNDQLLDWPEQDTPRRAGVSSFGIGGTNAHLILEEAPPAAVMPVSSRPWQILMLSARSDSALHHLQADLAAYLQQQEALNLADASYTLAIGRRHFSQRLAVVCRDVHDAASALLAENRYRLGAIPKTQTVDRGVAFLFPGQGSQYLYMATELYQHEAVFREHIDYCAEQLQPELNLDLRKIIYPARENGVQATDQLEQTWLTQPALFAVEYALAKLWMSWGVQPQAMIGHSLGEYVAACLAGVFSLDDALKLVAQRGHAIWQQPRGGMLAVSLSNNEVQSLLGAEISLAAINSTDACVVSGSLPAIEALTTKLTEKGIVCQRLHTSHAFHSLMMEPAMALFKEALNGVTFNKPQIPFISNLTGTWITAEAATDPDYWLQHLRQPVNFAKGIGTLLAKADYALLEVGPGTVLNSLTRRNPAITQEHCILSSLPRPRVIGQSLENMEMQTTLDSLSQLWCAGVSIDWSNYFGHEPRSRIPLPIYPFERQRYWIDALDSVNLQAHAQNLYGKRSMDEWFYLPCWKPTLIPRAIWAESFPEQALWLIFSDDSGLSRQIIARLQEAQQIVITVSVGERFQKNTDSYLLNPRSSADYLALIESIATRPIHKILHFWSLDYADELGYDYFESHQLRGYYSLLFLGQALSRQNQLGDFNITVISNHLFDVSGTGETYPEKITLLGPCLVMPQELPQLSYRCLDVVLPASANPPLNLVNLLLAELVNGDNSPQVAYRGHQRLIPHFEQTPLKTAADGVRQLRPQGVYLITGGLGHVGLLLAKFLAQTVQARLVLVNRSSFPAISQWPVWLQGHRADDEISLKIQAIRELEKLGAEVLIIQADVANDTAMQAAILQTRSRFGALHGVIHAAGKLNNAAHVSAFTDIGFNESQAQFSPKIHGLYALEKALRTEQPDFCLLISSTAAVLGGLGFAAYSAANLFLDAFAVKQSNMGNTAWISSNWDGWLFAEADSGAEVDDSAMSPAESVEAFHRVVCQIFSGRVIIAKTDLQNRFKRSVKRDVPLQDTTATPEHTRPALSNVYVVPETVSEHQLVAIWRKLFGFDSIGIHDDFFELGGDSMLAIRIISAIKERFGQQLSLTVLLHNPTIHLLAKSLDTLDKTDSFSPLVAIQTKGSLPALYCVPGTGGNVLYLHELARCLAQYDRPFYGLQAAGLDGVTQPLTSIEEIAAFNISALQKVQSEGPYYLAGHSFGSWVALEMAQQLQKAGYEVPLLVVLDTGAPSERDLSAVGGWDDTRWLIAVAETLGHMYKRPIELNHDALAQLSWDDQVSLLAQNLSEAGITQQGSDASDIRGFIEVYKAQAKVQYIPDPNYPVKMAVFRALEPLHDFLAGMPEHLLSDETWGWQEHSQGQPIMEYTPGDHLTMVTQPHVNQLAQRLHLVLSSVQINDDR